MIDLQSQPAELRFTLEITRAATGKTDIIEMVGYTQPEPQPEPIPERTTPCQ